MIKKLRLIALTAGLLLCLAPAPAQAVGVWGTCDGDSSSAVCADTEGTKATELTKSIINTLLFMIGITAVILIVHSGLKYVTSRGDPAAVKAAKDTLLYAVVGLIVALLSFVIVNFVVGVFDGQGGSGAGEEEAGRVPSSLVFNNSDNTR